MSRGVNKIILIGNVGKDPEVRYGANGNAVTSCTVATTETWKDKNTGEKKEDTEWHRVVLFGKLAEVFGEFVTKGRKVYIEGKNKTRKYEKDGQEKYITEVVAATFELLDSKNAPPA